jgi:DCN1-like protein 4/5
MGFLARLFCLGNGQSSKHDTHKLDLSSSAPNTSTTKVASTTEKAIHASTNAAPAPPAVSEPVVPPTAAPPSRPSTAGSATKPAATEPYSKAHALALFERYVDEEEPDSIGPEGFERLCSDAGLAMDGAAPLVLAWVVGAKEMAKISRAEWEKGMDALQCVAHIRQGQ